jgi:hypothetical protein
MELFFEKLVEKMRNGTLPVCMVESVNNFYSEHRSLLEETGGSPQNIEPDEINFNMNGNNANANEGGFGLGENEPVGEVDEDSDFIKFLFIGYYIYKFILRNNSTL